MQNTEAIQQRISSEIACGQAFRRVRLPDPVGRSGPRTIDALWTRDGAKPCPGNLALLLCEPTTETEIRPWQQRLRKWDARALLLPVSNRFDFILNEGGRVQSRPLADQDALVREVARHREELFTPRALSRFQLGQLSLASLETTVSRDSFSFLLRAQDQLVKRVGVAIKKAIELEQQLCPDQKAGTLSERVVQVAFAYLAARILEDKGYFGPGTLPENDPRKSLDRAVDRINGFLKQATGVVNSLQDETHQSLGHDLGIGVTFALMDYHHIGQIYERMAHKEEEKDTPHSRTSEHRAGLLLQQHYTPTVLADRLLEHLPLERLRPESRLIFDPAAGSGSLLLAATRRLASMPDLPSRPAEKTGYLGTRIVGNDIDPQAELLTALKYFIIHESEQVPFPRPRFLARDYNSLGVEELERRLVQRPTVLVANPPFGESGAKKDVQLAAQFVDKALDWMRPGDIFGFVLPQIFLHSTWQGCGTARKQLLKTCRLLEVWELPEKAVGLAAQQATCVLMGICGRARQSPIKARTIVSRKKAREKVSRGYLGVGHLVLPTDDETAAISAIPAIEVTAPTIRLDALFFPFIGVTLSPSFPPIPVVEKGIECRRLWKSSFRQPGRFWADPEGVPLDQRWIRYVREGLDSPTVEQQREYLKRPEWAHRRLFGLPKLLISRSTNRDARDPLAATWDTTGFTPNNDIYCLVTRWQATEHGLALPPVEDVPPGWQSLTDEDQLLWLLGLLSSDLVNEMVLASRSVRHVKLDPIRELQLPARIDEELIALVRQMIDRDQDRQMIPAPDRLREELNTRVEALYGRPARPRLARVGLSEDFESWQEEQKRPYEIVTGQVLEVLSTGANSRIRLFLSGLDDEEEEADLPLPPELPGWTLDGTIFTAELSEEIRTFEDLRQRPWALRGFRHTPRPYLTAEELILEPRDDRG
ncbi:MAG: N-6 DNA methylase [bacterium]|nr:N-6 DNA methylase [bacterium]